MSTINRVDLQVNKSCQLVIAVLVSPLVIVAIFISLISLQEYSVDNSILTHSILWRVSDNGQ